MERIWRIDLFEDPEMGPKRFRAVISGQAGRALAYAETAGLAYQLAAIQLPSRPAFVDPCQDGESCMLEELGLNPKKGAE